MAGKGGGQSPSFLNNKKPNNDASLAIQHAQNVAREQYKIKTAEDARKKAEQAAKNQLKQTKNLNANFDTNQKSLNDQLLGATSTNVSRQNVISQNLENQKSGLLGEANKQASDATQVYSNLSTRMADIANRSEADAKNAMTLEQYMDPAKSQAFQNVNKIYQDQAAGEGKAGLADFGVLASLGSQAAGASMAGLGPMTAGQQMGMLAQGQRQAGQAYANTQRRMQSLRDQGLQQGFDFHERAYAAGNEAKNRYTNDLNNMEGVTARGIQNLGVLRNERGGLQDIIAGEQSGRASRELGLAQQRYGLESGFSADQLQRQQAIAGMGTAFAEADFNRLRGVQNDFTNQQLQQQQIAAQQDASRRAMIGAGVQTVGTVAGAAIGGPAGAAAGAGAGGLASAAIQSGGGGAVAQPQQNNYNQQQTTYVQPRSNLQTRMAT